LNSCIGLLELHPLKLPYRFSKLLALVRVRNRFVKCALRKADHLPRDTYASFIQYFNSKLFIDATDAISKGQERSQTIKATLYPWPSPPMTFSAGTMTSSNAREHVEEARMPSFCSFFAIVMPMSFSTIKHVMPLYPFEGST
jgi:hypothetical protein